MTVQRSPLLEITCKRANRVSSNRAREERGEEEEEDDNDADANLSIYLNNLFEQVSSGPVVVAVVVVVVVAVGSCAKRVIVVPNVRADDKSHLETRLPNFPPVVYPVPRNVGNESGGKKYRRG